MHITMRWHLQRQGVLKAVVWLIVSLLGLGVTARPGAAALFAYVTNNSSNTVSVIDTASNALVATVPVGSAPNGVAVTPDGAFAYVVNNVSNTVSVINTLSNTVVNTVQVGNGPTEVAITPDGAFAYVTTYTAAAYSLSCIGTP